MGGSKAAHLCDFDLAPFPDQAGGGVVVCTSAVLLTRQALIFPFQIVASLSARTARTGLSRADCSISFGLMPRLNQPVSFPTDRPSAPRLSYLH
jgi:hypothetical protein